jgi:uncharacterized protein with PQ loop repeat
MPKQITKHKRRSFIDRVILIVAVIEPIFTLPQAYIIYKNHNASDVSIITWIGFNIMTLIWVWYAIEHKDKVVLVYQGLFFLFNTVVIIGAFLYGGQWL